MFVRACSNIHLAGTGFDRLNTEVMRKRTKMLVLGWRRWLYFCGIRVPSPYLYDRGMIVIPTSP